MKTVTVSSKRQITLSKSDLEHIGVMPGQQLILRKGTDSLVLEPAVSVVDTVAGSLAGYISSDKKGVDFEKIMQETKKKVAKQLSS